MELLNKGHVFSSWKYALSWKGPVLVVGLLVCCLGPIRRSRTECVPDAWERRRRQQPSTPSCTWRAQCTSQRHGSRSPRTLWERSESPRRSDPSCFLGAFPPVDLRAVNFVRAILISTISLLTTNTEKRSKRSRQVLEFLKSLNITQMISDNHCRVYYEINLGIIYI